jgi:hypothetical protein
MSGGALLGEPHQMPENQSKEFTINTQAFSVQADSYGFTSCSYADIVTLVDEAVIILQERGIRFTPGSVLHKLFADARKLDKQWTQSKTSPNLVTGINAAYAEKIARIISTLNDEPGIDEALQRISGADVNLSNRSKSQGKDALWELSLLTALKRRMPAQLIDPPDIVVDFGFGNYSIACKKIYERKSLVSRLRDGAKQIRESENPGFIALNIDDLLPGEQILTSQTPASALQMLSKEIREFVEDESGAFGRIKNKTYLDGVLISASTISDIKETSTRLNLTTTFDFYPFQTDGLGMERFIALRKRLSPRTTMGKGPLAVNITWPK